MAARPAAPLLVGQGLRRAPQPLPSSLLPPLAAGLRTSSYPSAAAAAAQGANAAAAGNDNNTNDDDEEADAILASAHATPPMRLLPKALANRRAAVASRKPAVKRPARHQWHYCDPAYDPAAAAPNPPPPANVRAPPFAPARAQATDFRRAFLDSAPGGGRGKGAHRRAWRKNLRLATDRWRAAWQRRLAEADARGKSVARAADAAMRAASWREWREVQGGVGVGGGM